MFSLSDVVLIILLFTVHRILAGGLSGTEHVRVTE